jgi:hypothetical protein
LVEIVLPNKLSRAGGGGLLDQAEIRLTQPQVELEALAELGKIVYKHVTIELL